MLLSALQAKLGAAKGARCSATSARANDPEAPVVDPAAASRRSSRRRRPRQRRPSTTAASSRARSRLPRVARGRHVERAAHRRAPLGDGAPAFRRRPAGRVLLPRVLHGGRHGGGGFDTRGALFPGVPFVVIGRGLDDAWSATSSQADNTDAFVETLCGDDTHYMYRANCRAMTTFNAGVLSARGRPTSRSSSARPSTVPSRATRPSAGRASRSRSSARHAAASCCPPSRSTSWTRTR